jgi:molybdopterin-guanine dinucleotide biosynthesis protein A
MPAPTSKWKNNPSFHYDGSMKGKTSSTVASRPSVEICILAGGLSSRMGRDKARMRVHGQSLLSRVKAVAVQTAWAVRVIRRDLVPRCGPLGGVCTALRTTRADAVVFLACDMPFVTAELIRKLVKPNKAGKMAVFTLSENGPGFPFLLRRETLPRVEEQIDAGQFSLQSLAAKCRARMIRALGGERSLFNVNTTAELMQACRLVARRRQECSS